MTRYAYVDRDKGEIIEIHDSLPTSWQNYSNFNLMDVDSLRELGWYPIVEPGPPPEHNYLFDTVDNFYSVGAENVYSRYVIRPHDPQTDQEKRTIYMNVVRGTRGHMLQASDWTMLPDMIESKGEAWKTQWASYRQQLRDFPAQLESLPIEELPNFEDLQWPTQPSA